MHHVRRRILRAAVPFVLCLCGAFGAATSAQAAARVPFTIIQTVTGPSPSGGGEGTFTATVPLCPSGTWVDTVHNAAPNSPNSDAHSDRFNLLVGTVFTCDDGSGSFFVQSHVFFTFTGDVVTNTGPSLLLGGTGAYVNLEGNGINNGSSATNQGTISGFINQL
jgi:hypothetical protein